MSCARQEKYTLQQIDLSAKRSIRNRQSDKVELTTWLRNAGKISENWRRYWRSKNTPWNWWGESARGNLWRGLWQDSNL